MLNIILIFVFVLLAVYQYLVWNNNYFKIHKVPHIKPDIGFGNIKNAVLMKVPLKKVYDDIYNKFKAFRYCGYFNFRQPGLLLIDNDLIKTVMIKDIGYFNDNAQDLDGVDKYMSKNLFNMTGEHWRILRTTVSPAFSSGKLKAMFSHMITAGNRFTDYLQNDPKAVEADCHDVKELCSKFAIDSVGGAVLSMTVNEYGDKKSEFRKIGEKVFATNGMLDSIKYVIIMNAPWLASLLGLSFVEKSVGVYLENLLNNQLQNRKEKNIKLNDFLDYMQNMREKFTTYDFDIVHMVAQTIIFLADGFHISSTIMAYALVEIASNPEVLTKLRKHIDETFEKHNNQLSYDMCQEMKYLEWTLLETLRMHPVIAFSRKRCSEAYPFPPARDDGKCSEFIIPAGMVLYIPVAAIHRDPLYYPEPDKFDPERFNEQRASSIPTGAFLAFGEGPRQCLGMRFAMAQMKLGMAVILRNLDISLHSKTQVPLVEDPTATLLSKPIGGFWLKLSKRK